MGSTKNKSCEVKLTVPFHDLDPMQMVWHGNYLKYFDIARSALFDNLGVDLISYFKRANYLFYQLSKSISYIQSHLQQQYKKLCIIYVQIAHTNG